MRKSILAHKPNKRIFFTVTANSSAELLFWLASIQSLWSDLHKYSLAFSFVVSASSQTHLISHSLLDCTWGSDKHRPSPVGFLQACHGNPMGFGPCNRTVDLKYVPCTIDSNFTSYSKIFWCWIPSLYAHSPASISRRDPVHYTEVMRSPLK